MRDFKNGLLLDAKMAGLLSWYFFAGSILIFCTIEPLVIRLFLLSILLIVWAALVFRVSGVQIDFKTRKIRRYTAVFGYKIGKWRPCNEFPFFKLKHLKRHFKLMKGSTITFPCRISAMALVLHDKLKQEDIVLIHEQPEKLSVYQFELEEKLGIPCISDNYL